MMNTRTYVLPVLVAHDASKVRVEGKAATSSALFGSTWNGIRRQDPGEVHPGRVADASMATHQNKCSVA